MRQLLCCNMWTEGYGCCMCCVLPATVGSVFSFPLLCHPLVLIVVSSGLQNEVPNLGLAEQQAPQLSGADDSLQCNEQFDHMHASSVNEEEGASGCSPGVAEMASRPPTQQEIQHMDELDLSINLGSLLGPGDSWMVEEEDHLELSHLEPHEATAANGGSLEGCKPFSELFP